MMLKGMPSFALIACLMMNHNDDARMNFASMLCPSARCHHHGHLDLSFCFIFSLTQSVPFTLNNYKHLTVSLKIKIKKKLSNTHFNTHLLQTTKTKAKKKHTLLSVEALTKYGEIWQWQTQPLVQCSELRETWKLGSEVANSCRWVNGVDIHFLLFSLRLIYLQEIKYQFPNLIYFFVQWIHLVKVLKRKYFDFEPYFYFCFS